MKSPTPQEDELSKTDRNSNPVVGKILDIIDEKRSRYAVAVAVADYVAEQVQSARVKQLAYFSRNGYLTSAGQERAETLIEEINNAN